MAHFVVEFSPRVMSLELDLSISTHKEEGNPTGTSTRTTLAPKDPEVCNEPPQDVEEHTLENFT